MRDDGPGVGGAAETVTPSAGVATPGQGIGLRNTANRLEQLYGDTATLELLSPPEGGTIARVTLPYRPGVVSPTGAQAAEVG